MQADGTNAPRHRSRHWIAGIIDLDGTTSPPLLGWLRYCLAAPQALPVCAAGQASWVAGAGAFVEEHQGLLIAASLRPCPADPGKALAGIFRQQGPEGLCQLPGSFALAIWDEATRQLWLGRDVMGNRPLFLRRLPGKLVFASALAPLLSLPPAPELDRSAICNHLLALPGAPTQTAWLGIERLPPGAVVVFDHEGRARTVAQRTLQPSTPAATLDTEDWVEGFAARFDQALRRCLPPTGAIGATLSGGLDSSSVVARALKSGACQHIEAYAARFPATPTSDEGQWLALLRPLTGLHLHDVDLTIHSPLAAFRQQVANLAEPILIQNLHLWTALFGTAGADGLSFLLDGHDGDSALNRSQGARTRPRTSSIRAGLRALARSFLPDRPRPDSPSLALLEPEFAQALQARERLQALERAQESARRAGPEVFHRWRLERSGYPVYATERMSVVAGHFGIELGHPFYDPDLLAWCLALPEDIKLRDGYSRWVLRQALAGLLPEPLRLRPDKTSLADQFHRALIELDGPEIDALLDDRKQHLQPYLDVQCLRRLWAEYRQAGKGKGGTLLWPALTLAVFLDSCSELVGPAAAYSATDSQ